MAGRRMRAERQLARQALDILERGPSRFTSNCCGVMPFFFFFFFFFTNPISFFFFPCRRRSRSSDPADDYCTVYLTYARANAVCLDWLWIACTGRW